MNLKDYNHKRYVKDYRKSFLQTVKSYTNTLQKLGATVTLPDDATFQANVDAYLAVRPRRERIDWEVEA